MNTFILMWNPTISNFKKDDYDKFFTGEYIGLSWSVWDYKKLTRGDRVFMVRTGQGKTGLVMAGYTVSRAHKGEDWSSRGREVYYADIELTHIAPYDEPFIPTAELTALLPGFDWTQGHSGQLLPADIAKKIETLWQERYGVGEAH